jgi:HNH endonuclease
MDGKTIAKNWNLAVTQARYSEWGNWYSRLTKFPAALIDANGYIVFENEAALLDSGARLTEQINVKGGISILKGYVRMIADIPGEVLGVPGATWSEGSVERIAVNRYERSKEARRLCIKQHGAICAGCDADMALVYGEDLKGFIHVHHLRPISELKSEYKLDPINDLRPLCPNCHAVVHRFNPTLTIDEVRERYFARRQK